MEELNSRENEGSSKGPSQSDTNASKSMISLTIKTLDSQNHKIDEVDEDSSIKDFKDKIVSTVGIAADRQRLIYCGRVLNDEKKLKEYSLNGKVVHLVQRQPPGSSAGPDRLAASEARARSRGASPSPGGRHQHHIHVHGPINASLNVGPPSMLVRLNLARSMLRRANTCVDRLENPDATPTAPRDRSANESRPSSRSGDSEVSQSGPNEEITATSPASETTPTTPASASRSPINARIPSINGNGRGVQILAATGMIDGGTFGGGMPPELAQAIQSAVNQAIHSTQNLESNTNNSEGRNDNSTSSRTVAMSFQVVDGQLVQTDNQETSQAQESSNSTNTGGGASNSTVSGNRNDDTSAGSTPRRSNPPHMAVDHPPPRMMTEVMAEYRRTQRRLDPHWDRLDTMLQNDPVFENDDERTRHQNLFRSVTEIMHFLSHAQHALSDAMLELGEAPPRRLRARPFLAPMVQSAVVQNVPIQVQVPRGGMRRTGTSSSRTVPTTTSSATPAVEPMEMSGSSSDGEHTSSNPGTQQGSLNVGNENTTSTADIEVSMEPIVVGIEVGPEITIDPREGASNSSNGNSRGSSPPTSHAQISAATRNGGPSAGMIQNMIQAALSNMGAVANVTVQEITPDAIVNSSSINSSSNSTSRQPGQNSRARGNTQTQPTTSTRTRSSTQVINVPAGAMGPPISFMNPSNFHGGPIGPVPNNNFDILLPCNSHHIPQNAMHRGGMARGNRRVRPHAVFQQQQRQRSSSVPPRGPVRGIGTPQGTRTSATGNEQSQGDQENIRASPRPLAASATGSPQPSPRRRQQTANLPGGGSVTIDFDSSFDFGSFFGGAPPPQAQHGANSRSSSNQGLSSDSMRLNFPTSRSRANDRSSELEPSLNNLMNVLQQGEHQMGQPNIDGNGPIANAFRQAMSDDGMLNIIQGVVGQVMGAMGVPQVSGGGSADNSPTISQFLESMPDYSYTDGEDIFTDFLMSLARVLTFRDLIGIIYGGRNTEGGLSDSSREAIGRLQDPMQTFMRRRMLNRTTDEAARTRNPSVDIPDQEEIESAFLRLLDDSFSPHFESCAELANVRENIDFSETLHNFLTVRLTELASRCIWNNQLTSPQFGTQYYEQGFKFLSDLTRLCLMCFSDGQSSIERVVQNRLSNIGDDVGSTVGQWTMSAAIGHLRNYVAGVIENGENDTELFNQFVVRPGESADRRVARQRRIESRRNGDNTSSTGDTMDMEVASVTNQATVSDQQDDDETFETPRSSPEIMVTDCSLPEQVVNGVNGVDVKPKIETATDTAKRNISISEAPNAPSSELAFPADLLPRSQAIDMVVGRESWHRQVPPEWVPIITRDVQGQQHMPPIAPYSDAYLSTQPAKKRRLAEARKPEGSIEKVISDTLKDAIKVTGVQPKSVSSGASAGSSSVGNSNIVSEVAKDTNVKAAIKNDTRAAIKRRIQQDPDFTQERFPDSQEFVKK